MQKVLKVRGSERRKAFNKTFESSTFQIVFRKFRISPFLSILMIRCIMSDNDNTYELEIERNQPSRFKNLFVDSQISRSYKSARISTNVVIR